MDDWNDYLLILALHRATTLRGAAIMLGTTHTTVARRLEQLQRRRDAQIFEKFSNGYRITTYGNKLLGVAHRMESMALLAENVVSEASDEMSGPITLSAGEPLVQHVLLDALFAFKQKYPAIELKIDCSMRLVDLNNAEADVVVRGAKQLPEHLVGRKLFPYALSYYAQRQYFETTPPNELGWIAPTSDRWPEWLANSPFPHAPVIMSFSDIDTRFKALVQGYGMARTVCFKAQGHPDLIRLPNAKTLPQEDLWVLTHPELRYSKRIKVLMQTLTEALIAKRAEITGEES